jgi:hypothetical protein
MSDLSRLADLDGRMRLLIGQLSRRGVGPVPGADIMVDPDGVGVSRAPLDPPPTWSDEPLTEPRRDPVFDPGSPAATADVAAELPGGARMVFRSGRPDRGPDRIAPVVEDILQSGASGVLRGVVGTPGLLGDVASLGPAAANLPGLAAGTSLDGLERRAAESRRMSREFQERLLGFAVPEPRDLLPTGAGIQAWWGRNVLPWYEPRTRVGRAAEHVGTFVGGAAGPARLFGGTPAQVRDQALRYGLVPGAVAEGAAQTVEGSGYEDAVRAAVALGVMGGLAVHQARSAAPGRLMESQAGPLSDAEVAAARNLMAAARDLPSPRGSGVELTFPEALHQVTGGRADLGPLMRAVASSPVGSEVAAALAARRDQIRGAFHGQIRELRPERLDRGEAVPRASEAAGEAVSDVIDSVGAFQQSLFDALTAAPVPRVAITSLMRDPRFRASLERERNRPFGPLPRGGDVANANVLDRVRRDLDHTAEQLSWASEPDWAEIARTIGLSRRVDRIASGSPAYLHARDVEASLARDLTDPIERSRTQRIAEAATIGEVRSALSPRSPSEPGEIFRAINSIAGRDRPAAQHFAADQLTRLFSDAMAQRSLAASAERFAVNPSRRAAAMEFVEGLGPEQAARFRPFMDAFQAQLVHRTPSAPGGANAATPPIEGLLPRFGGTATARELADLFLARDPSALMRDVARRWHVAPSPAMAAAHVLNALRAGLPPARERDRAAR